MEYRMYGWGNDPANVLPNLKARGYHSVSGGYNKETAAICRDLGLSYYLSANGFSDPQVGYTCADGTVLPKEICPCDDVMRQAKLAQMKTLASLDDITGITIDFCRYPSMVDGNIHLFGCFCETCMARMEAADFDAVRIRAAVLALQRAMTEKTALNPDCDALADWIKWKKRRSPRIFAR